MEILASLDDINANLDGDVFNATDENTVLIQVSVARVIRGYLSRIIDQPTLNSWQTPETTPDIIREIAGKIASAQLYVALSARTSYTVDDKSFSQKMYDEAMVLLNMVVQGTIPIPGITETPVEGLSTKDFFPTDATDRAFTMGQQF